MSELVGLALNTGGGRVEDIRTRNTDLQGQRRAELVRAGFPAAYLDDGHMCPACRDTGYAGIELCGCLLEIYREVQRESLSDLFKLGGESFESFSLDYYDDAPSPETGISPRRGMEIVYRTCVEYARKFGGKSMNLFFNGGPGLGKTFLSACIARVVADGGWSVVYDSAGAMFSKYGDFRFARPEDAEEARGEVKRYMDCDLLIIDDLGTEMTTALTQSALYEIINTRLITGRKTIVSSNLTPEELRRRYTQQIASRLEGEYQTLAFRGEDIRKKKNAI